MGKGGGLLARSAHQLRQHYARPAKPKEKDFRGNQRYRRDGREAIVWQIYLGRSIEKRSREKVEYCEQRNSQSRTVERCLELRHHKKDSDNLSSANRNSQVPKASKGAVYQINGPHVQKRGA